MKVAAVIVNYNDVEDTLKFVREISEYEIINKIVVVDNLSTTAGAFEKLKSLETSKVNVIQSDKNGGYDYGNNFGVRYLELLDEKYDYIIISNPDIKITEKAIKNCLKIIKNDNNIGIVAPRMYNKDDKPIRRSAWKIRTFGLDVIHSTRLLELLFYKILRNGEYSQKEFEKEILEVEAISGAFFIIKYDVLKEIGLLDENVFLFYEEDILAKKLAEKKYKIISLNSEKFIHYESQTIGKTLNYYKKMKQMYKSKIYYHNTYNNINSAQRLVFKLLFVCRCIELIIEIPIRKLLGK